ncbi:phage head completion protein [Sphingomonas nostoxanthinifaciens]|uniref:phage head completion protein n=1 Tax=Sphingomonas nostoxanthinifaciens TaxID=2872652 RepID=UPI001CC1C5FA|nr:head-tail adaptor protein [Sphingomonas nostoxanthinifaciens]UAK25862.1 head-tail adaptor protein [Sphingomonas nostoxanthinifaciens]
MSGFKLRSGDLDRRIRIEGPVEDPALDGAGSGAWAVVVLSVPAQVQDMLPSRGERLADGVNLATRPARVRIRFRPGITSAMRFGLLERQGDGTDRVVRTMQIISEPAELGRRVGLEFMVEDYSSAGNSA